MARTPKHSLRTEIGITLSRDVKLKAEWPKFLANMIKTVVNGFAAAHGAAEHAGEAIASLLEAGGAISIEAPPGERGWRLFALGFAWSFDELRARGQLDDAGLEPAVRAALAEAKVLVDGGDQIIPVSFLERPTTLPLYMLVRDAFVVRKAAFRPGGGEADNVLRARFDAAFDRAIFLLWSQAPEQYLPLAAALTAPGAAAHAFRLEWEAYRASLIHDFEVKPVFGQETSRVSLAQLYVPLRAIWIENAPSASIRPASKASAKAGPSKAGSAVAAPKAAAIRKIAHIVLIDHELETWATGGAGRYELKLVGGGPGSGKSTTAKALARRLASRDDCRPLLVPLSHIDPTLDLRESVNRFFKLRTGSPFRQEPLARRAVEDGPPLVIIFDGLDELARPGEAANDVARDFMVKLGLLAGDLRGECKDRLRVVVFGRLPSFQAAQRYAGGGSQRSYEVQGFKLTAAWEMAANVRTTPKFRDARSSRIKDELPPSIEDPNEQELAQEDQRSAWWKRYAKATGASESPPDALTGPALSELTSEPLLCYLLALSGYLIQADALAFGNINQVYRELIDEVWRRGWGDGRDDGVARREGAGKFLNQNGFNRLMETIALAGWQGGDTRVCSEINFRAALKALRTESAWDAFVRDNGPDITNLAMNFYLRSAEVDRNGFEFTHKSFGDHLAARAILTVAFDLAGLVDRRIETVLKEWFDVTCRGRLTMEILDHMQRELQLHCEAPNGAIEVRALQNAFQRIASTVLRDGLPSNGNTSQAWREAESWQRNAEVMVWGTLSACAWARSKNSDDDVRIEVEWPDAFAFGDLLRRVATQSEVSESVFHEVSTSSATMVINAPPVMRCFAFIAARDANLAGQALWGIDLRSADLRGARLDHASIVGCSLSKADMSEARFIGASIEFNDWANAILDGADLSFANLEGPLHSGDDPPELARLGANIGRDFRNR